MLVGVVRWLPTPHILVWPLDVNGASRKYALVQWCGPRVNGSYPHQLRPTVITGQTRPKSDPIGRSHSLVVRTTPNGLATRRNQMLVGLFIGDLR